MLRSYAMPRVGGEKSCTYVKRTVKFIDLDEFKESYIMLVLYFYKTGMMQIDSSVARPISTLFCLFFYVNQILQHIVHPLHYDLLYV